MYIWWGLGLFAWCVVDEFGGLGWNDWSEKGIAERSEDERGSGALRYAYATLCRAIDLRCAGTAKIVIVKDFSVFRCSSK